MGDINMFTESEYIELKEKLTKDIKKEIVAFANSKGGTIYIGIRDNGNVIGLDNISKDMESLSGMIREGIKSDLTLYTKIRNIDLFGKEVIELKISNAPNKPYYLSDKGLKPSGVYIRHGNVSVPVLEENIIKMLKEQHDIFETEISHNQDLTFTYLTKKLESVNLKLDKSKYKVLNILDNNNFYTNLGLLLSDECPYTIKCAVFNGKNKIEFKDRKEFTGSLLKQLDDTLKYLNLVNRIKGKIENFQRIDIKDYPDFALRETVLNAIIHRNYNFTGSILISIFDDRIEVNSLGGLMLGLTIEDIISGSSQSRNKNLSNIFYRLKFIENFGTGIGRMFDIYKEYNLEPKISVTDNTFKITLPNINYIEETKQNIIINLPQKEIILNYLKESKQITREIIEKILSISQTRAKEIISEMIDENLIERKGSGRSTYYTLKGE